MFPYMIGKEEMGNYTPAFNFAKDAVNKKGPAEIAKLAGVSYDESTNIISFESFGQKLNVKLPECDVRFAETNELPLLEWRISALHYLANANGSPVSEKLAHFRQMPGGNAYETPFKNRSVNMLSAIVSRKPQSDTVKICEMLGGKIEKSSADVQAVFNFAPNFPITVQIWLADSEIEGSANILFSESAKNYLPTEDMAVVASLIARFIVKQFKLI